jgi:phosphoribosylformylglycinamidine cyclo-ligase
MVATMAGDHTTVGIDIVHHGCNDLLCQGASPLTFLDYVAMSKLDPRQMEEVVKGMASACRDAGIAILGGETAELPGMYRDNEYDLAGVMTGIVERDEIVDGKSIKPGMLLVGLASNGLHTNGYTLARKVCFETAGLSIGDKPEGLGTTVGEALLLPHINYAPAVLDFLKAEKVYGMAHITGGGIAGNLVRVLPKGIKATVKKGTWPVTPIFEFIQKEGNVPEEDMYRTFNMGIGFIIVVAENGTADKAVDFFNENGHTAFVIGETLEGERSVTLE